MRGGELVVVPVKSNVWSIMLAAVPPTPMHGRYPEFQRSMKCNQATSPKTFPGTLKPGKRWRDVGGPAHLNETGEKSP